ncbi:rhodanese-like domain-containing protein [Clavibacter michiganensis]|uniref:rhodanese-like domain-containing protein n=1 Tax=Clavibacter michiganensis TaxID=28447 RepID=UPI0013655891|nr:rhodanese-like domain-containing protein [Clavibacter michiganensis]MDO4042499.1 rhodanese-like domain-containing protein [Clavibacter michiganensis]MDO4060463.1 rhodanese-like domain-containing protein [Clavibacter michiganensis]MDO4079068.1 rhodanese-like domain-containing protein [Clavibacter michiganensis]MDO4094869.1 rhodanese-like domain-containing protein [Clavibacter michiganensis]MDO4103928.1 rhodanese-like domain-containing protein [Clavibacter michiganensis]
MTSITVQQLAASAGATIIDVREPDEYAAGHARSAVNVPLSELGERIDGIPADRPVHFICQSGGRSARATEALTACGIDAIEVTGGTTAWIDADLPTDRA